MWQVDVPLGPFYDAIVAAGRQSGYFALLTALVREADASSFYEDISRYWDSLHDVTGADFLFVLAGPEAKSELRDYGVPDAREPVAYSSQNTAVVAGGRRLPLARMLGGWSPRVGTLEAPLAADLARSQTLAINQLRKRLALSESQLPCIHLSFIGRDGGEMAKTIPISDQTIYEVVKSIVSLYDEPFSKIRKQIHRGSELKKEIIRLERRTIKYRRFLLSHLDADKHSPEQIAAARRIVQASGEKFSIQKDYETAREECFRDLAIWKGTEEFRALQSLIDTRINYSDLTRFAAISSLRKSVEKCNQEIHAEWDNLLQYNFDSPSLSNKTCRAYKIFIAYHSPDRWIAKKLHSALSSHVSTFLDIRCLRPGDRWVERVKSAQESAEMTVVLVGSSGGTSWFHQAEYLRAIELARTRAKRLVPLYISGSPEPVPYGLEGIQGIVTEWASGVRADEVSKTAAEIAELLVA